VRTCPTRSLPVAAAVALWFTAPAMADDTGFYIGANAGRVLSTYRRADIDNTLNADLQAAAPGFALGPTSIDKDHVMWSADVGYMLNRNFGVEASYIHLGSLRYQAFGTAPSSTGATLSVENEAEFKSGGPALALVAALPMSNFWEVDARVGGFEGRTTTTSEFVTDGVPNPTRTSKTTTSVLLGAGTGVSLTNHVVVRLDYLRLESLKDNFLSRNFNVDLVTVGVAYVL
jgi:opacity protein-like surface antigen